MSVQLIVECMKCRKQEGLAICEKFDSFDMDEIGNIWEYGTCYDCQDKSDDGE